jgi:hypothetical protein
MTQLFILIILALILWTCIGFYWGAKLESRHQQAVPIDNIKKYLEQQMPNEWTAYQHGVKEGYTQGLRDGQGEHDEPA